jgi:hypothetical protein
MVCIEVISEENGVAFVGNQGDFEPNVMRPIIINDFPHSAHDLGAAFEARLGLSSFALPAGLALVAVGLGFFPTPDKGRRR